MLLNDAIPLVLGPVDVEVMPQTGAKGCLLAGEAGPEPSTGGTEPRRPYCSIETV